MPAVKRPDPFSFRVLSVVRRIPPGTRRDLRRRRGARRAAARGARSRQHHARVQAGAMCRAIASSPRAARLGGYGGNEIMKRSLLVAEGVVVSAHACASSTGSAGPVGPHVARTNAEHSGCFSS